MDLEFIFYTFLVLMIIAFFMILHMGRAQKKEEEEKREEEKRRRFREEALRQTRWEARTLSSGRSSRARLSGARLSDRSALTDDERLELEAMDQLDELFAKATAKDLTPTPSSEVLLRSAIHEWNKLGSGPKPAQRERRQEREDGYGSQKQGCFASFIWTLFALLLGRDLATRGDHDDHRRDD